MSIISTLGFLVVPRVSCNVLELEFQGKKARKVADSQSQLRETNPGKKGQENLQKIKTN